MRSDNGQAQENTNDAVDATAHCIGSRPHKLSNICKTQYIAHKHNQTTAEKRLRDALEDDYNFHQSFWTKNNLAFQQSKKEFISSLPSDIDKYNVPAHLMAQFYQQFLNEHWKEQMQYNVGWWLRSWRQIPLYFLAYVSRLASTQHTPAAQ
eukprot:m.240402 g.240402  ORF g.240402 m.240402 type:complete len:151 (+) comp15035_c0_seq1:185-637(+)